MQGAADKNWAEVLKALPLLSLKPSSTFGQLLETMATQGLHRLYITDDEGKPVSIVTLTDVLREIVKPEPPAHRFQRLPDVLPEDSEEEEEDDESSEESSDDEEEGERGHLLFLLAGPDAGVGKHKDLVPAHVGLSRVGQRNLHAFVGLVWRNKARKQSPCGIVFVVQAPPALPSRTAVFMHQATRCRVCSTLRLP